jgi:hypothetical protein
MGRHWTVSETQYSPAQGHVVRKLIDHDLTTDVLDNSAPLTANVRSSQVEPETVICRYPFPLEQTLEDVIHQDWLATIV